MRLLLLAAALVAAPSSAQIAFSAADYTPAPLVNVGPSTVFSTDGSGVSAADADRIDALVARTGAAQTWDFTDIDYSESVGIRVRRFADPSGLFGAASFPTATVAYSGVFSGDEGSDSTSVIYARVSDSEYADLGGAFEGLDGDSTLVLRYEPDGLVVATFPFTFGTSLESEAGVVIEPGLPGFEQTVRLQTDVVGFGTLVLPTGSYECLMVRREATTAFTIDAGGVPLTFEDVRLEFEWITKDGVAASASNAPLEPDGPPFYVSQYVVPGSPTSVGGGPEPLAVTAAPNPTASTSTVRLAALEAGPARVAVYDALGREVAVLHDGPIGAGDHAFATSGLAPGVYVVRVVAGARVGTVRLVVAR